MRTSSIICIALLLLAVICSYAIATPSKVFTLPPPPAAADSPNNVVPPVPTPAISATSVAPGTTPPISSAPNASVNDSTRYNPIVTLDDTYRFMGWKTSERYEFADIDGLQESYNAEEPIIFYVSGRSNSLTVDEKNGFNVVATIYELPTNTVNRAKVVYDPDRRAWRAKFSIPRDKAKEYKILLNLFCDKNDGLCANTYGAGTQINKIIPVQIN